MNNKTKNEGLVTEIGGDEVSKDDFELLQGQCTVNDEKENKNLVRKTDLHAAIEGGDLNNAEGFTDIVPANAEPVNINAVEMYAGDCVEEAKMTDMDDAKKEAKKNVQTEHVDTKKDAVSSKTEDFTDAGEGSAENKEVKNEFEHGKAKQDERQGEDRSQNEEKLAAVRQEDNKMPDENSGKEEESGEQVNQKDGSSKEQVLKKARGSGRKQKQQNKVKDGSRSMELKNVFSTPSPHAAERPVRERKSVERLVEVIAKEPNRKFVIDKGHGIPLKDIPNVAYKLARKKPADLKVVHRTLFGRRGKAVDFKSHILQFSGFAWREDDEKHMTIMKEKLDKHVKDVLLDMCDLFDIPTARTNVRKEDLVSKLLDFIAAPRAMSDVQLSEEQSSNSRKRRRMRKGSVEGSAAGTPKTSRKKIDGILRRKMERTEISEEDEDDMEVDNEIEKECRSEGKEEDGEPSVGEGDESGKEMQCQKRYSKAAASGSEKSSKRYKPVSTTKVKTPTKRSCKQTEDKETANLSSRKRKSRTMENLPGDKEDFEEKKSSGQKGRRRGRPPKECGPDKEDLRKVISEILKTVNFNTATFSDILKQLAEHYKMDMTPRKAGVKLLIQEELSRIANSDSEVDGDTEVDDDDVAAT